MLQSYLDKGMSIKDAHSQGGEVVCPVLTFCGQAGEVYSDTDVRIFWCKKL